MARKIFMNKQHALSFAKAVSGTVEKEPISFNRQNGRPSGYVVFYKPENLTALGPIPYKEPEVDWDLLTLHTDKLSFEEPSYETGRVDTYRH